MNVQPFATEVRGLTLRGTHYLPGDPSPTGPVAPRTTAVLLHGFGGSRVETTGVFVTLARALVAAGIGVVAFDRAGHGESDGEFFDTTASGDIADTRDVLAAVRALPEVDADDVHLVGMSLGSVIAAAVAAEEADVRSLTMWSTASVFVDDIRAGQIQGRSLAALDAPGGFFDFFGMRMGPAMRDDALGFDPYARAAAYRGPALLLHGTADFVPLRCAERYTQADVFGERAELVVVEGADHGWAQLPQRDDLIARTVSFIQNHSERTAS
ncbi:alpha/beta hydrolase [Microbacterium dextranolyticum]|uniref:Alpha/beta hydrolase n=1 Tax=Microbacterium dextranolyticum TaxID=36806 RepID=A0A9W6HJ04_9MICO|nr:alpha/beta hydrolase [Microbacterium dextranolyticum]MBM7461861.1 pimeloyl-ACP methyl ester carboxylesterase [Microbacterium dextranolyticum]GLJ94102.1 alpha/beta hydrolase [Microbacterium dextranolyticum]